jgi:hypothetical protein
MQFFTSASRLGHCAKCVQKEFLFFSNFSSSSLSSSFSQRWTKCLLALTYYIVFNFKPTVFEILMCLVHIPLVEQIYFGGL